MVLVAYTVLCLTQGGAPEAMPAVGGKGRGGGLRIYVAVCHVGSRAMSGGTAGGCKMKQ